MNPLFSRVFSLLSLLILAAGAIAQKLEPGDAFTLDSPEMPSLQADFVIGSTGVAKLPFGTRMVLAGLYPPEAERRVREHFEAAIGLPLARLKLVPRFNPAAPIRYAGALEWSGTTFATKGFRLSELLNLARPKVSANLESVEVRAYDRTLRLNRVKGEDIELRPGDRVFVPERRGGSQIYVLGSVNRPGAYDFVPGLTVRKAVELGGGLNAEGDGTKAEVLRDQKLLGMVDITLGDAPLEVGDVVQIPKRPETDYIYVIGGIAKVVRFGFRTGMTLLQAIELAAPTLNPSAKAGLILLRYEKGRMSRGLYPLAALRSQAVADVPLKPGDRIEISEPGR